MIKRIFDDVRCVFTRDPAARSMLEVLLTYPGVHAVIAYRLSNRMWRANLRLPARIVSAVARFTTGIEIHPGATIGRRFFIDHGMGVVVGETAEVGDDCTLYHGVTLGGTSLEPGKRHPTLEDGVIVGAGAKILGPITVGAQARIGSNAVVVKDVPAARTAVGIPSRLLGAKPSSASIPVDRPLFSAYGEADGGSAALGDVQAQLRAIESRVNDLLLSQIPVPGHDGATDGEWWPKGASPARAAAVGTVPEPSAGTG